jgi:hypothetical protein
MKRSLFSSVFLVLAILAILIPAVSAVSITESPDVVQPGQQIALTISGLPDGASFSLNIGGKFAVTPGDRFSFETRQFNMPFSLTQGTVSATTQGTRTTAFSVGKGDETVQVGNAADANGYFTISKAYEISSGVYDYLTLSGRARPDASVITSNMNLYGIKKGPTDSAITFTVNGIDNGEVYVTALVNGQQVLYKDVIVGNGVAMSTPTPSPTPEVTTAGPTDTTTPVETATITGTATVPVYTAPPTPSTAATGTTTAVPPTTAGLSVFSSADRKVTLTTEGIDYAALLMVSNVNPPANWLMIGNAYSIAPDSLVFSTPATLSFTVPPASGDYAYFIAQLQNNEWVVVPSSAGTDTIDAQVSNVGTYALMAYRPESTIPQTTVTAAGQTTAEVTVTMKGTPKVASIAQAAQTPAPSATKSPLDALTIFGALAVCSAAFLVFRKQE